MDVGIYLTGAFGQARELYAKRNEAKRRRLSWSAVEQQIFDDIGLVTQKQQEAKTDFIIDPMFDTYYLFQPFVEHVSGATVGPQENWFNNNVFYWRPQLANPLNWEEPFNGQHKWYDVHAMFNKKIYVLPSPLSLLLLSDVSGYSSEATALDSIAQVLREEVEFLVQEGAKRIQFDEPALVVMNSLGSLTGNHLSLLRQGLEICATVPGANTSLQTYYGEATDLIPYLITLPTQCIGIDCAETRIDEITKYSFAGKELALGLVDARSTSLEDPVQLAEIVEEIDAMCSPDKIWVATNTETERIGFSHALKKLSVLAKTKELLTGEVKQ